MFLYLLPLFLLSLPILLPLPILLLTLSLLALTFFVVSESWLGRMGMGNHGSSTSEMRKSMSNGQLNDMSTASNNINAMGINLGSANSAGMLNSNSTSMSNNEIGNSIIHGDVSSGNEIGYTVMNTIGRETRMEVRTPLKRGISKEVIIALSEESTRNQIGGNTPISLADRFPGMCVESMPKLELNEYEREDVDGKEQSRTLNRIRSIESRASDEQATPKTTSNHFSSPSFGSISEPSSPSESNNSSKKKSFCSQVSSFFKYPNFGNYIFPWHRSLESESRWLSGIFAIGAMGFVIGMGGGNWWYFFFVIVGLYYHYDRFLATKGLKERAPYMPRIGSISLINKEAAKTKFNMIVSCLSKLEYSFVAAKLLSQKEIATNEQTIISVLELTNKEELNYIITNVNLALLFFKVKDGDVMAPGKTSLKNRTKIMELLAVTRLHELDISARVALLDAIQRMRLSAHPKSEQWVQHIFLSTKGSKLIRLKTAFDTRGGSMNLHQLVWNDIHSVEIRKSILRHIQLEGANFLQEVQDETARLKQLKQMGSRPYGNVMFRNSNQFALEYESSWSGESAPMSINSRSTSVESIIHFHLREEKKNGDDLFDESCTVPAYIHLTNMPHHVLVPKAQLSVVLQNRSFVSTSPTIDSCGISLNDFKKQTLRKILSDVDDTLFSSGGKYPAGLDARFPPYQVYPGVLEFYKELDLGVDNPCSASGYWNPADLGNLVFLSARPHVYKDKSERASLAVFEKIRKNDGMYQVPALLAGSIESGAQMLFSGNYKPMAQMKFKNFDEYAQLYSPEHQFCFIGDNGQGDVLAAEMISEKYKNKVEAVFIHQIQPLSNTPGFEKYFSNPKDPNISPENSLTILKKSLSEQHIYFFGTYIGAALQAYRLGMIHINGLRRVAMAARRDFLRIFCKFDLIAFQTANSKTDKWLAATAIEQRRIELNLDIALVNEVLAFFNLFLVPLIDAFCYCPVGAFIIVPPFPNPLKIINFRGTDGMYLCEFIDWPNRRSSVGNKNFTLFTKQFLSFKRYIKGKLRSRVVTLFGTGVLTSTRPKDGMHEIELAQSLGVVNCLADQFEVIAAARGDRVNTPYGLGVVVAYRPDSGNASEGIYHVRLLNSISKKPHLTSIMSPRKSGSPFAPPLAMKVPTQFSWGDAFLNQKSVTLLDETSKPSSRCNVM